MSNKNQSSKKEPDSKKDRRHELYKITQANNKETALVKARINGPQLSRQHFVANSSIARSAVGQPSSTEQDFALLKNPLHRFELGSTSNTNEQYNENSIIPQTFSNYAALKAVPKCTFCGAKKFEYESPGFCCGKGAVKLISHQVPLELKKLYVENTEKSKLFRTYIRTYNNIFAFTSLGVNYDKDLAKRNKGIYTFRVQGKMYHFIDDLVPSGEKEKNLQLYYFDSENELTNRMACSDKLTKQIVENLMEILQINPYSIFLKSLITIPQLSDLYIALKSDAGLNQRMYNLPTTSEVAGIWIEEDIDNCIPTPHIRIFTKSDRSQLVNYYYGCYDPLQYPLLFPYGENGWHCGIKKIKPPINNCTTRTYCKDEQLPNVKNMTSIDGFLNLEDEIMQKGKRKRETVSCREYYSYKLQIRDDENIVLHSGRLLQQYVVDEWIKIETQRLDFASFNQDLFRTDMLGGLLDILRCGEREASQVGKHRIIPLSFTGGPRDMRRRYMDAMTLVQRFGNMTNVGC